MTHVKAKSPNGWSLKEGLAAQYGAQAGLDPDLAASAGEAGWYVLKSLRDAADERDPARRAKRVKQTQRYLEKANLGRELMHAIQQRLASLSLANRVQPSVNPETGLQEFALCSMWDPDCENVSDPIQTLNHVFTYDANGTLLPGQHRPHVNVFSGDSYVTSPSGAGAGIGVAGGGGTSAAPNSPGAEELNDYLYGPYNSTRTLNPDNSNSPEQMVNPSSLLPTFNSYAELFLGSTVPIVGQVLAGRDTVNNLYDSYGNLRSGNYDAAADSLGRAGISALGLVPGMYGPSRGYGAYRYSDEIINNIRNFNDMMTVTDPIRNPQNYPDPLER